MDSEEEVEKMFVDAQDNLKLIWDRTSYGGNKLDITNVYPLNENSHFVILFDILQMFDLINIEMVQL